MFNKKAIEELIQIRDRIKKNYVSIMCNREVYKDNEEYICNSDEEEINASCSHIDYFLKESIKTLSILGIDFDKVEFEFLVGAIYDEKELEDGKKIIKGKSKPLKEKARYYTGNVKAYKDNKLVKTLTTRELMNYQGIVNYNKFIASVKNEGLSFSGPQTYEELINFIQTGISQEFYITADLTETKEKEIEQIPEQAPIQEVVEKIPEETKPKRRRLFRK